MNAIALDCSTEYLSVALFSNDKVKAFRHERVGNRHSDLLLATIDELVLEVAIQPEDIERIYIGQGPGSFTGIRVGLGVARGLALGLNAKAYGQSSLHLIAAQVTSSGLVHVLVDARMKRCYSALFEIDNGNAQLFGEISEVMPQDVVIDAQATLVGNGWLVYREELAPIVRTKESYEIYPDARCFLSLDENSLHQGQSALAPIYVRNDVATPKKAS